MKNGNKKPKVAVGPKVAFTAEEVAQIEASLIRKGTATALRDRALFRLGVDTMLRSSDLLSLTVSEVYSGISQRAPHTLYIKQQKTGDVVQCELSLKSVEALQAYIAVNFNDPTLPTPLFEISDRHHRRLIKKLAAMIHLEEARYSTHSVRRTKSKAIYAQTKNLAAVRVLLGHKSLGATATYLGVDREDALNVAREVEI